MPTIKRNADKIITRLGDDGVRRVSCSCCQGEAACCVYPASCGVGPQSVLHYGSTLEATGSAPVYGDTFNGVALEGDMWAVYRNGTRTTRDCLGLGTEDFGGIGTVPSVQANLATTYSFSFTYTSPTDPPDIIAFGGTFNLSGPPGGGAGLIEEPIFTNQCGWGADIDFGAIQLFDEGLLLIFNPSLCRWEIQLPSTLDTAQEYLYAFKSGSGILLPTGSYTAVDPTISDFVIT